MGTVLVVASGKGGTGKTSFSAGVSVALCSLGEKVLLIDADAGLKSQDLALGMSDRLLFSYFDVMRGAASLKEAALPHHEVKNLRVLTAPHNLEDGASVTPGDIAKLLHPAREHFSFTVIDCPAGIGGGVMGFASAADMAAIVATPDAIAIRDAQTISTAFFGADLYDSKLVINRVRKKLVSNGHSMNVDQAMDAAGLSLLGVVPEDIDVTTYMNTGKVLMLNSQGPAQAAYLNIARRLTGARVPILDGVRGRY